MTQEPKHNMCHDILTSNFSDFIDRLNRLVSIPSFLADETQYPFGDNIQKALEEMIFICKEWGFRTYIDPKGYYGYAELGQGTTLIGVLGHLDVVPPGDLMKWNHPPFSPIIKEGKYYGRGSQDDKGPLLASIYALKCLVASGFQLNYRVRFIFGTDEENLWRDMPKYMAKEEIPSLAFTPDSTFPLVYAEKGLLQWQLSTQNKTGLIFKGGDAFNSVPSSITVSKDSKVINSLKKLNYDFNDLGEQIEIIGKSVHAQVAETGINAINRYLHALEDAGISTQSGRFVCENLMGYSFAEPIFGEIKDEHSGALKFNLGKIEFTEDEEILYIDIRIPVTCSKELIEEKLSVAALKYGFEYKQYDYLKSIYMPLDSYLVKTLMSAYQEITSDMESQPIASGGATYARAIDNCVAFGAVLPNSPKTEHQPNECISLDDMLIAMKIYAHAFEKFNNE
ncbi:MAG: Sapep family Mn(2+)-dependent dipeptidase [Brevinema sp.]